MKSLQISQKLVYEFAIVNLSKKCLTEKRKENM